jgi:membrane dipeptidase
MTLPAASGAFSHVHDPSGGAPAGVRQESVETCAKRLQISRGAAELFQASEVIDLHIDSFIWTRLCGYRLDRRHTPGWFSARGCRQVDVPRLREVGISAATWVITTNPARSAQGQLVALSQNLTHLERLFTEMSADVEIARDYASYRRIRSSGKHAAFLGIQGGNALASGPSAFSLLDDQRVLRVTLLHLSSSALGATSSPLARGSKRLRQPGLDSIVELNARKILVDLAHISERGFYDALEVHSRSVPPIVTHTGVCGVYSHWRNLSDEQIRAIADRGGIVGIMYHTPFLRPGFGRGRLEAIVDHIEHVVKVAGSGAVALGSDWDGAITTPSDMATCSELPRLVEELLQRGWRDAAIQQLLGLNFLRVLESVRPG